MQKHIGFLELYLFQGRNYRAASNSGTASNKSATNP